MHRMLSALSRWLGGCAVAMAMGLQGAASVGVSLAGCPRVILGTVHLVAPRVESPRIPVADLLIDPRQFPARHPAVVLAATAVYRALQDLDGIPAASVVT